MLIPRSMLLRRQLSREEEKRASAEGQLRDLVQQSSEDMLLVDLNGQIIEANNQACRLVAHAEQPPARLFARQHDPRVDLVLGLL